MAPYVCHQHLKTPAGVFWCALIPTILSAISIALFSGCQETAGSGDGDEDLDTLDGFETDSDSDVDREGADSDTGGSGAPDGDSDDPDTGGEETDIPDADIVEGCEGQKLRKKPAALNEEGPWPVGARTTKLNNMTIEVWYPGKIGSHIGCQKSVYDIRDYLQNPAKVSDEENPIQECNCYRDLPIDSEAGPYPVVVFVHGTAGFRTQNLEQMTHWASRGFVVIAADHPHICFKDMVANVLGTFRADQAGDARRIFNALEDPVNGLAFLAGHVDTSRKGIMGHSAGAGAVAGFGDVAQVVINYAGSSGLPKPTESALFIAGSADTVGGTVAGYAKTNPVKRSVLIEGGGHLVGSSLCVLRDPRDPSRSLLDIIKEKKIGGILGSMAESLFQGCNELPNDDSGEYINELTGIEIFNFATAGVLEEKLHCRESATESLSTIAEVYGDHVASFEEQLNPETDR